MTSGSKGLHDKLFEEAEIYDVVVVGAGMAGLSAARALAEAGRRVLLLESQSRIGGRILTERVGDEVFELGAEFVHGRPPELIALIEEARLTLVEREGTHLNFEGGRLSVRGQAADSESEEEGGEASEEDFFAPLDQLEDFAGPDVSFADWVATQALPEEVRKALISYVEGFNAADYREISAQALGFQQKAEEEIEGDRAFHVEGGYDRLPAFLAAQFERAGGTLRADTRVLKVMWNRGRVVVQTNRGSFTGRQIVVTLPLAVLQANTVAFEPAPGDVLTHASRLRMGQARRISLHLRERFWAELDPQPGLAQLSFLFTSEKLPAVWWTGHPEPGNALTGWVGGPRSSQLEGLSAEELGRRACSTLAEVFRLEDAALAGLLRGCFSHDWYADPNFLGAYSYVATGGLDASLGMAEPVEDTLYFAGEHTDTTGHWGTVHAALRSGLRAAAQILNTMR